MSDGTFNVVVPVPNAVGAWQAFRRPVRVLTAFHPREVAPRLCEAVRAVDRGYHAAGFIAYEAAPAFDAAYRTHPRGRLPLLAFGIFEQGEPLEIQEAESAAMRLEEWRPTLSLPEYRRAAARIRDYLRAGDTYQVNFTFRMRTRFAGRPFDLFARLHRAQQSRYSAYLETDTFAICSASPELFFALSGDRLTARPMKGTSRRGVTAREDAALARRLRRSEKNRAENVMIVDMVRNDLGRIAEAGSVAVPELFTVERYPTVLQMTSSVTCRTRASVEGIVAALFPCASITGAPKVRTMEIIRELEDSPRGVYTGCIGCFSPRREALFSVAIRTVTVDKRSAEAEYGVGGAVVWDSVADEEYEECRLKSALLMTPCSASKATSNA